jgi:hypothetical protein
MDRPNNILRPDFKQLDSSSNDLFSKVQVDYMAMAKTLIEFNKAIYQMANDLRESLLTYSARSSKKQIKG